VTNRRGFVVAVAAVVLAVGCSDGGGSAEPVTTTVTSALPGQAINELVAGDCLVEVPDATSGRAEAVDCEQPHRAEVYATHDVDDGPFPSAGQLSRAAGRGCAARYAVYAGEPIDPTTDLAFAEVVPSEASWADGDRLVVCLALPSAGASAEDSIAAPPTPEPL
jgi:hypothetical protein